MTNTTANIHETTRATREIGSEFRKVRDYKSKGMVTLSYDDSLGNGHNTFSITLGSRAEYAGSYGGCMFDEIRESFPEYAHLIKWHLTSTDGPMHYIANTIYHAEDGKLEARVKVDRAVEGIAAYKDKYGHLSCEDNAETYCEDLRSLRAGLSIAQSRLASACGPNLESARRIALAPNATIEQLQSKEWLEGRRGWLVKEFKTAMESVFTIKPGSK